MIKIYKFEDLGHVNHDWLNARHHFSFSNYYNPERNGFGTLKVINDDIIKAKSGFDTHPHRDMEIITYVRSGAITHKDSNGNVGRTEAGDVQVMSAGTGIKHSEFNLEDEETNLYQIWITPKQQGVKPRWDSKNFPKNPVLDKLHLLVSGNENDDALFIYQDAKIYGGKLRSGNKIIHPINNQAYILASAGEFEIDNVKIKKGDGAEITQQTEISITAITDCELLIIDSPPN